MRERRQSRRRLDALERQMDIDDDIARANRAKRGSPYLNNDQAAAYLKISRRLLMQLRRAGKGPNFRLHGRFIQYHIDDLNAWSDAQSGRGASHGPA